MLRQTLSPRQNCKVRQEIGVTFSWYLEWVLTEIHKPSRVTSVWRHCVCTVNWEIENMYRVSIVLDRSLALFPSAGKVCFILHLIARENDKFVVLVALHILPKHLSNKRQCFMRLSCYSHGFRHTIVPVAVDPLGCCLVELAHENFCCYCKNTFRASHLRA